MAKKKTENKVTNLRNVLGLTNMLRSETTDFLVGAILILFSAYLITAMSSYLNTGAADQSLLEHMKPNDWLNSNHAFQNYCGSFGAKISYLLITLNFGYAAFLVPLFIMMVGIKMMQIYLINLWKCFFGIFFTMIWLSMVLTKTLSPFLSEQTFNAGGRHGLVTVEFIENLVGPPGLSAILVFTALALLTFFSRQTIAYTRRIFNPLKTLPNKVGDIISEAKSSNTKTNDKNSSELNDNSATENIQGESTDNTALKSAEKEKNKVADNVQVIDLTDFSHSTTREKESTKRPIENIADKEAIKEEKMPSSHLTIEVGKEEKASTSRPINYDINTPINPLEPFTRYKRPSLDLLKKDENDGKPYIDMDEIKSHNEEIVKVLKSFGIEIREIKATVGPTITLYEITPAEGIRITKIRNLEDDIALRLSALGVRIIAPIPGKGTIGIEVPNKTRHNVSMESILNSKKFQETKYDLPIALGKTITNEVFMADLTKIPHLLVAGATGQGKSVGLNVIITSLLYKKHPNELKLVLIDPKKVEFSVYAPIAEHFMASVDDDDEPIITDVTKVVRTLKSLCTLMDHRYDLLKLAGARNIKEYNDKYLHHKLNRKDGHEFMCYIVVIIDEFGDLIMTAGKEVEMPIARIAQLARAVGIHMIIATQRPTTSIITGNIKANFPGRIAFKVSSMMDSRIILDRPGANQLIGMGDMLYLNGNEPTRVQCAFISTSEIQQVNEYISKQSGPTHPMELPEPKDDNEGTASTKSSEIGSIDPFFEEAARAVVTTQQGSTSMIQRRFSIGFNRAGRLMDQLEAAGIVGAARGGKPRDVLIAEESQLNMIFEHMRQK